MSLKEAVEQLQWVHQIELTNGLITPGAWPPNALILRALSAIEFTGKKVLDIGCWDGLWTFEAEKRGAAEVYATDDISQRWGSTATFDLAHQALQSKAHYDPNLSLFDIARLGVHDFEVVLFCGIYYHLKDPLLAFARLRQVMADGGLIVIEGDVLEGTDESYARFFYGTTWKEDVSNWWIPTIPCLRGWIEASYFEIVAEYPMTPAAAPARAGGLTKWLCMESPPELVVRRRVVTARAVTRQDKKYGFPDAELSRFDPRGASR